MNNILILGGNGFIGSNLAELFVNKGENVIVFDREESDYKKLNALSNKIKIIKGNFDDPQIIKKIFDENKIDIVIHLISSVLPATPFHEFVKNKEITSTINLLNIMKEKGVNKIIYFSSGGAIYGLNGEKINKESSPTQPINFYGWTKLAIETYIQTSHHTHGINYLILRVSNLYGKNQNPMSNQGLIAVTVGKLLRKEKIEIWGDGEIIRDYINIDDCSKALYLLIQNNKWNNIYNTGSSVGTSVNQILEIIKNISAIDFPIEYEKSRKIDVPFNILDTTKIKNEIPWKITTKLEDGIKKYWEELKNKS